VGAIAFIALIVLLWKGWPISLWLAIALAGIAVFDAAIKHAEGAGLKRETEIGNAFKDALLWVAVGLGIVCLAQAVLRITGSFSPETVKSAEEELEAMQHGLTSLLSLRVVFPVLLCLLALAVAWPQFQPVKRFVRIKKLGARLLIVLTTITSFTFFSSLAVSYLDPDWIAARRSEAAESVAQITESRRELLAIAWVNSRIRSLPPPDRKRFSEFLSAAAAQPNGGAAIEQAAARLAQAAPKLPESTVKDDTSVDRVETWITSNGPLPSLGDIIATEEENTRLKQVVGEAETALEETFKSVVSALLPDVDSLVKPFLKALTSTLAHQSVEGTLRKIKDFQSAVELVKEKRGVGRKRKHSLVGLWHWHIDDDLMAQVEPRPDLAISIKEDTEPSPNSNTQADPGPTNTNEPNFNTFHSTQLSPMPAPLPQLPAPPPKFPEPYRPPPVIVR
jgi:hypothetical protein